MQSLPPGRRIGTRAVLERQALSKFPETLSSAPRAGHDAALSEGGTERSPARCDPRLPEGTPREPRRTGEERLIAAHASSPQEVVMESRAKLLGHPVHPMLIVLPLGLFIGAVAFDAIYLG